MEFLAIKKYLELNVREENINFSYLLNKKI